MTQQIDSILRKRLNAAPPSPQDNYLPAAPTVDEGRSAGEEGSPEYQVPTEQAEDLRKVNDCQSRAQAHSPAAVLWLQSRTIEGASGSDVKFLLKGQPRPVTLRNIGIAFRLIGLLWYRFWSMVVTGHSCSGAWARYAAGEVVSAFLPAFRLWAPSRLMDQVQKSLKSGSVVDLHDALEVGAFSILASTAGKVCLYLLNDEDARLKRHVSTVFQHAYLSAQFRMSARDLASPYIEAMIHEAGVFTRFKPLFGTDKKRMPFDVIDDSVFVFRHLIMIFSQLYLLRQALVGNSKRFASDWSTILLLAFSIAPALIKAAHPILTPIPVPLTQAEEYQRLVERSICNMNSSDMYKQEMTIFDTHDWLLEKWHMARVRNSERKDLTEESRGYLLLLDLLQQVVDTGFYTLLALKLLPTNLSLGSIKIYKAAASGYITSIRDINIRLGNLFQSTFNMAACLEVMDLAHKPQVLQPAAYRDTELHDYEVVRNGDNGMSLVATDLSFRYPGAESDILHSINLVIKPGTSLAIVGINGAGKTTLIKALMGLYHHEGSLLLNGHPIASYDPVTIHRRTSCLFQNYSRYNFTLRENVGMGQISHMSDDELVIQAMERGGSSTLLGTVGLEGMLNRTGSPDKKASGDIQVLEDKKVRKKYDPNTELKVKTSTWGTAKLLVREVWAWASGHDRPSDDVSKGAVSELDASGGHDQQNSDATIATEGLIECHTEDKASTTGPNMEGRSAFLSGGQWQRVALSRAFMRATEADLVVFDEPSASLDPRAEADLFARIHDLSHQNGRKCTTIFVSHRFSTVKNADQIAVVGDGTITECGSHAELMANKGQYAELFTLQKAGFED